MQLIRGISKWKLHPPKRHTYFYMLYDDNTSPLSSIAYTDPPRNLIQKTELSWSSLFEMTLSTTSYTNLIDLWWLQFMLDWNGKIQSEIEIHIWCNMNCQIIEHKVQLTNIIIINPWVQICGWVGIYYKVVLWGTASVFYLFVPWVEHVNTDRHW